MAGLHDSRLRFGQRQRCASRGRPAIHNPSFHDPTISPSTIPLSRHIHDKRRTTNVMRFSTFLATLLLLSTPVAAQEQIVDLYLPKIAVAQDGSYALAAEALMRSDIGRDVLKVIVQRYAPNGAPVGPTHVFSGESCSGLDLWLSDYMQYPEIAFQPNGTLVVAMQHSGEFQLGGDGVISSEITLGGIGPDGSLLDLAPQYSSCVQKKLIFVGGDEQDRPRLAITPTGELLVTADGFFNGADLRNVALRVLDAAGNELIEGAVPHDDAQSQQRYHMHPDVATNGQIILSTWHECPFDQQGNFTTCDVGAQFASVTAQGLQPIGGNLIVNAGDAPGTLQLYPSAAMNSSGASVIAWADARDGIHGEIYAQRFSAAGQPTGGNLKVSTGQGAIDARPEVAILENGRFMIAWTDSSAGRYTARARTFDASGSPEGAPVSLAPAAVHSGQPSVAPDGNDFAFIYLSAGANGVGEIGSNKATLTSAEEASPLRSMLVLDAYPNPFSGDARVTWRLTDAGHVTVRVFDVLGREIDRLADAVQLPGEHSALIDGGRLAPGVYFVELVQGTARSVQKLVRTGR